MAVMVELMMEDLTTGREPPDKRVIGGLWPNNLHDTRLLRSQRTRSSGTSPRCVYGTYSSLINGYSSTEKTNQMS
jgi:hypothetical protein